MREQLVRDWRVMSSRRTTLYASTGARAIRSTVLASRVEHTLLERLLA